MPWASSLPSTPSSTRPTTASTRLPLERFPRCPSSQFQPAAGTPFGKAFSSTTALQSPIDAAVETQASADLATVQQNLSSTEGLTVSTYQRLAKLTPKDATTQLQLGQYAEAAGNNAVAIAAFKKFLVLAPTDVDAATVERPEGAREGGRRVDDFPVRLDSSLKPASP